MARQPIRGNPEEKMIDMTSGFRYGMNVTMADDLLPPSVLRNSINFDLGNIGELVSRKGFGLNTPLTQLLYPTGGYGSDFNETTHQEVFFALLQNENSAWQRLADAASIAEFIQNYGSGLIIRFLRLMVVKSTGALHWEDVEITISVAPSYAINKGDITQAAFDYNNILMNWEYVDKYGRFYFTNNDKGMLIFDSEAATRAAPWTYVGSFTGLDNSAYKPNGIEVRKIGFNVLGTQPIGWLFESELTTETIQGVYLTTADRKPIQVVPSEPFQVNILYTGDTHAFTIEMLVAETALEATYVKNTTLSVAGSLAVYDVTLTTPPNDEVEFSISFDSETVVLEPFYDYYPAGSVPATAEAVEQLNVGKFKLTEMYDRMVYYNGNAIWFSEVDVYDYIPNYNFVLVPLDKTDEIVKIKFFRDSYIVFTKRRIYKLYGDFESNSFTLDLVNDSIGCISTHTPFVVNNEMYFLSSMGLRSLRTDTFKQSLENIREFDEAIQPLIPCENQVYALLYKDQYFMFTNQRGRERNVIYNMREYPIPDQVRYYYKQQAFMTDIYARGEFPKFIFMENGELYSFRDNGIYRLGDSYDDFGLPFSVLLETIGMNLGYQTHEKKVKYVLIKAGAGTVGGRLVVQVLADGEIVSSSTYVATSVDEDGNTVYKNESPLLEDSVPVSNELGVGSTRYYTRKYRTSARGKNLAIRIAAGMHDKMSIQAIGFLFKLGKVRE